MSRLIKTYLLVTHYGKEDTFVTRVQAMLDDGYELVGGVSVCKDGSQSRYSQALVKTTSALLGRPVIDDEL